MKGLGEEQLMGGALEDQLDMEKKRSMRECNFI